MPLSPGARQLPTCHLSARVPWNDTGWDGRVCKNPKGNSSCLVLPRIAKERNDTAELTVFGQSWEGLSPAQLPACAAEKGAFMAPFGYSREMNHPYKKNCDLYDHFLPTRFDYKPYSAACVPFRWMLSDTVTGTKYAKGLVDTLDLGFQPDREPDLPFDSSWVQERGNQLCVLDTFFSSIKEQTSLVFFYAKRTPLTDDPRRVLVGAGRVLRVDGNTDYRYVEGSEGLRCTLWERNVHHSIRPSSDDGFLLPYHELLEVAANDSKIDPAGFVALVPAEDTAAFSFGTEHVSHDQAIAALLACATAFHRMASVLGRAFGKELAWIDRELNRLWKLRGPFPGFGSALVAFGIPKGTLVAYAIADLMTRRGQNPPFDPWPCFEEVLNNRSLIGREAGQYVGPTHAMLWRGLKADRRRLLMLLSRFDLLADQTTRFYQETERDKVGLRVSDEEILANPYRLYECDREHLTPIQLSTVDRGLFTDPQVAQLFPVPQPSAPTDALDPRRVRALVTDCLEQAADAGHTVQPRDWVIQSIRERPIRPECPCSRDLLDAIGQALLPEVHAVSTKDGQPAFQLALLTRTREIISRSIERRKQGQRHQANLDWRALIDAELPPLVPGPDETQEQLARREKADALRELFESRISVLAGPAGTGKTTLLKALCKLPQVRSGGLLLLAPTGKARVRLEQQTGQKGGKTVAQFLRPLKRYNTKTGAFRPTGQDPKDSEHKTVIVDEASMLTEEQLAALIDALAATERFILVGDPRQLPPIGAGRPFVDIATNLAPTNIEGVFPRVTPCFAELTIRRRQAGQSRDDLVLADAFGGRLPDVAADEVWAALESGATTRHVKLIEWAAPEDLERHLLQALVEELPLAGVEDENAFEISLGGSPFGDAVYFSPQIADRPGSAVKAEAWQILSPIRPHQHGVDALNRTIQQLFRKRVLGWARPDEYWKRKTAKPFGRQGILYGDKVINTANGERDDTFPDAQCDQYLANGEIGIVVGQYKGRTWKPKKLPWKLEVEFATQRGFKYGFSAWEFGEESQPPLELAYALTVHKAQGSEFGLTFVVLPNPCLLLSRELLYTALTRQKDRVVVFHQGPLADLRRYSDPYYSDIARRLTNLFHAPAPVKHEDRFMEERLIHRTLNGELVQSKSEVIIANLLRSMNVAYRYEQVLVATDGSKRYPDFTIADPEAGRTVYIEHLGLLHDPSYRERWERKLTWYAAQGVLPLESGGGSRGTLITTQDDANGSINCPEVERRLKAALLMT